MAKLSIDFPGRVLFSTELEVQTAHLNRANHVGNSQYVELCNEASQRFFKSSGVAEYSVAGLTMINVGFSVQLLTEARCCDRLTIELAVDNFHRCGCDFLFRVRRSHTDGKEPGELVALGQFSFLCFDYEQGKVVDATESFKQFFSAV